MPTLRTIPQNVSLDGGNPVFKNGYFDSVQTTDATPTDILLIPIDGAYGEELAFVEGVVLASDGFGNTLSARFCIKASNFGGSLSAGSPLLDYVSSDFDPSVVVTIGTSGDNLYVRATGFAATTIDWVCDATVKKMVYQNLL